MKKSNVFFLYVGQFFETIEDKTEQNSFLDSLWDSKILILGTNIDGKKDVCKY